MVRVKTMVILMVIPAVIAVAFWLFVPIGPWY
jgi:hypothetical protein